MDAVRIAEVALERVREVEVAGETYVVSPATIATLIDAAAAAASVPEFSGDLTPANIFKYARQCRGVGMAVAILILGAGRYEERKVREMGWVRVVGPIYRRGVTLRTERVDRAPELARKILGKMGVKEVHALLLELVEGLDLSDFFSITSFFAGMRPPGEPVDPASGA